MSLKLCDTIEEVLKNLTAEDFIKTLEKFNMDKCLGLKDSMMYIIGSGSHFEFLYNCDYKHAIHEYTKMNVFSCVGTIIDRVTAYHSLLEKYHCMESSSGYVYCYILPISNMRDLGIKLNNEEEGKVR